MRETKPWGDDQLSPEQRKCKVKEKHVATSSLIEFPVQNQGTAQPHLQPTCKKTRASEEQSPHVMRGPSLRRRVEQAAQRHGDRRRRIASIDGRLEVGPHH